MNLKGDLVDHRIVLDVVAKGNFPATSGGNKCRHDYFHSSYKIKIVQELQRFCTQKRYLCLPL